ncbi:hypothetical protein M404DRAFT_10910 [Pisolithus tinctorius Marx 270]|uniref:Uncharacterized protein n=1 Tax=Pisolithus tinctorius Marx 270 TaxID=870435 RepID=A0A0C3NMC4_PISTI|nr:hypothetical protein M404DRAFT_10910 [Pisolithus tinctorius Marx 270]
MLPPPPPHYLHFHIPDVDRDADLDPVPLYTEEGAADPPPPQRVPTPLPEEVEQMNEALAGIAIAENHDLAVNPDLAEMSLVVAKRVETQIAEHRDGMYEDGNWRKYFVKETIEYIEGLYVRDCATWREAVPSTMSYFKKPPTTAFVPISTLETSWEVMPSFPGIDSPYFCPGLHVAAHGYFVDFAPKYSYQSSPHAIANFNGCDLPSVTYEDPALFTVPATTITHDTFVNKAIWAPASDIRSLVDILGGLTEPVTDSSLTGRQKKIFFETSNVPFRRVLSTISRNREAASNLPLLLEELASLEPLDHHFPLPGTMDVPYASGGQYLERVDDCAIDESYNILDIIEAAWITSDARAQGILTLYCDPMIAMSIESKDTAKLKWDDLKAKYGEPSAMTTFMEFQRLIRIQIKPKDDIMAKIAEISMIMAAIQGQGIDLNNKIKALILVHSMSQAWEQAPVNILSSIAADQLGPDTVIPRMKEVWSHKSGKTMLPQQEKASTSGTQVKQESNTLLARMNKPPLCNICHGSHNTQDHRGGGSSSSRGRGSNRGRGGSRRGRGGYTPYPQNNNQQQSSGSSNQRNQNRRRGKGKGKARANAVELEGAEANFAHLEEIPEDSQEYYSNETRYHPGAEMPYTADAAENFDVDICAIEFNREQPREETPEFTPPAPIEQVYTSDLGTFLGSHTIMDSESYDPDLSQQDLDMAMEAIGQSQSYPVDGSTGELAPWYLDEIQGTLGERVESQTVQSTWMYPNGNHHNGRMRTLHRGRFPFPLMGRTGYVIATPAVPLQEWQIPMWLAQTWYRLGMLRIMAIRIRRETGILISLPEDFEDVMSLL